jgi:F0F1-type ATP synthase assembly protein I
VSEVSARGRRDASPDAEGRALGLNIGWTVFSYLLSGMAAYGLIGWLIGRAVHVELLFPIGMLVGLAISIGFIIWRYGRNAGADGDKDMKTGMSATASRRASHRRGIPREEKSR